MIEGLGRGSRNILVGKRSAVHCLQKVSHDVRHVVPVFDFGGAGAHSITILKVVCVYDNAEFDGQTFY